MSRVCMFVCMIITKTTINGYTVCVVNLYHFGLGCTRLIVKKNALNDNDGAKLADDVTYDYYGVFFPINAYTYFVFFHSVGHDYAAVRSSSHVPGVCFFRYCRFKIFYRHTTLNEPSEKHVRQRPQCSIRSKLREYVIRRLGKVSKLSC